MARVGVVHRVRCPIDGLVDWRGRVTCLHRKHRRSLAFGQSAERGLLKLKELSDGVTSPRSDHVCFLLSGGWALGPGTVNRTMITLFCTITMHMLSCGN